VGWPYANDPSIHVHPTPLYEAAGYLAVFLFLWWRRREVAPDGVQFARYLVLASGVRFVVEFVRVNPVVALGLTAAQVTSLLLMGVGAGILVGARRWQRAAA
jgi:phosphatidylglycerol:prolipoprotein diacylglycerol transferase